MEKHDYITKEYFDNVTKDLVTKSHLDERFELMSIENKQHMTDLTKMFNENLRGIGDYVKSIDEKVTRIDERVVGMDFKLTTMQGDIVYIKGALDQKADKSETLDLRRRVIKLERKTA